MFTNGSSYLYNATKKRAFFKEVTILIPQTWSDKSTYSSPGNATFNGADLIIAPHNPRFAPDGPNTALPYTKQFAGCGEQSLYIHMTSNFLLSYRHLQARVGDYGRFFTFLQRTIETKTKKCKYNINLGIMIVLLVTLST